MSEVQEEQAKPQFFAISETQLKSLADYLARLPYGQVQPLIDMIGRLPKIEIQNQEPTDGNS